MVSFAVDRWSQFRDGLKTVDVAMLFARLLDMQLSMFGSNSGPARWRTTNCVCVCFFVFRVVTALMGLVGAVPKEQHEMHPY